MRLITPLLFGILATAVASAQIAVNGPIEGLLFDAPTATLRAVVGVPGSATLGPSMLDGVEFGSVAPRQSYAIVFQAGKCQVVASFNSASALTTIVSGVAALPDGITWSADGTLAILYSQSGNWMQTLNGLPSAPALGPYLDISSLGGTLSAVASDPQGKRIAIAVSGTTGAVYLTSDSQSFVPVLQSPKVIALSFSADGTNLYALDSAVPGLSVVDLNTFSSQSLPLDGLSNPVAIGSDKDTQGRQVVYVASGSDRLLRIIDVASQQVLTDVPLNVAPTGINALGAHSFVIASRSERSQPLWLFTSSPQPAAYFVPAVHERAHVFSRGLR
jgi:hypothetical protein